MSTYVSARSGIFMQAKHLLELLEIVELHLGI